MKKIILVAMGFILCLGCVNVFASISSSQTEQVRITRNCRECKGKGYIKDAEGNIEKCVVCDGTGKKVIK